MSDDSLFVTHVLYWYSLQVSYIDRITSVTMYLKICIFFVDLEALIWLNGSIGLEMFAWFKESWSGRFGLPQINSTRFEYKSQILNLFIRRTLDKKCLIGYAGRTDARVHALSTYFTIDYDQNGSKPIDNQELRVALNLELRRRNMEIRINNIEQVDQNLFEAHRNVNFRRYVYRIAVKPPCEISGSDNVVVPIEEVDRCYFIK